ncbi:flap endonuclease 1-like [Pelodytes ibericus]
MGIRKLAELISQEAPESITRGSPERYKGKILAIDASVFIHQFDSAMPKLQNRHGDNISVLKGLFNRTAYLVEIGINPVYVFDGIPPDIKRSRVSVPKAQIGPMVWEDLEKMLRLLGVPFIKAPGEAEATCAALVAAGQAWGTVTEDMDALPFGSTRLIRNLKAQKNEKVQEYNLPKLLEKLKLNRNQFVDLCILLGCDYSGKIRGLGIKKALAMIQKHGDIEKILGVTERDCIPLDFHYKEARSLFLKPNVFDVNQIKIQHGEPDEDNLLRFLCDEKKLK